MLRLPFALASLLILLAPLAHASAEPEPEPWFEEQCAKTLPPNRISVTTEPSVMKYDFTKSVVELSLQKNGMTVLGSTRAQFSASATAQRRLLSAPRSAVACARVDISIVATASPQTVHVAKEFARGSCTHNYVLNHEFKHVHANQGHLERTADALNQELANLLGSNIIYGTPQEIERTVNDYVKNELLTYVQSKVTENEALHKAIDDDDSFEKVNNACKGELSKTWSDYNNFR